MDGFYKVNEQHSFKMSRVRKAATANEELKCCEAITRKEKIKKNEKSMMKATEVVFLLLMGMHSVDA